MKTRETATDRLLQFIRAHPLASVMIVASSLRLIAVLSSQGYLYSDDHYETASVAYSWLRYGLLSPEGYLNTPCGDIARFPLYTLFLHGIMQINYLFGIDDLHSMMYSVRAIHAVLSLLSVWAIFQTVKLVTKSSDYALAGGLIAAAHFAVPMLAVRNLIEVVGGHFWILTIYLLYKYQIERNKGDLISAGIVAGLAWMIRFQILFAVVAVPLVLLWQYRRVRASARFLVGFVIMVLLAGIVDYWLLGSFLASSVNHVRQGLTETAPYATTLFVYPAFILALFIPPLSIIVFAMASAKKFWREHELLVFTTLSFIIIHTVAPSRQERYMFPILPVLILLFVLVIRHQFQEGRLLARKRRLFMFLAGPSIAVNVILLVPATINYGHKGLIEPLVFVENQKEGAAVFYVLPEKYRIFPLDYGGYEEIDRWYVYDWSDLQHFDTSGFVYDSVDYFILYPGTPDKLPSYVDSLEHRTGPLRQVFHAEPSVVDLLLRLANPRHNRTNEGWVYREK